jgi:hypothetical protein
MKPVGPALSTLDAVAAWGAALTGEGDDLVVAEGGGGTLPAGDDLAAAAMGGGASSPKTMDEPPPGAASTRLEFLPVRKLPTFCPSGRVKLLTW